MHRAGDSPAWPWGHIQLPWSTQGWLVPPGPGAPLCSLGADQQQGQSSWENHILLQSRLPPWASLNCHKRTVEQRNGPLKGNGNHTKTRSFKAPQHIGKSSPQLLQIQGELRVSSSFAATVGGAGPGFVAVTSTQHVHSCPARGSPSASCPQHGPRQPPRSLRGCSAPRWHTLAAGWPQPLCLLPAPSASGLCGGATLTPCGDQKGLRDSTAGTESPARHRALPLLPLTPATASSSSRHSSSPGHNLQGFREAPCPQQPVLTGESLSHRHRVLWHSCCHQR